MSNLPWLLVGDFKVVRSFEESASDSDYSRAEMEAFDTCITNTELIDHHPSSFYYNWSNKQANNPAIKRLDRVLINDHWSTVFPNSNAQFLHPGVSDHAPGLVKTRCSWLPNLNHLGFLISGPIVITLLGVFGGRMFLAGLCSGFGTSSRILNSERVWKFHFGTVPISGLILWNKQKTCSPSFFCTENYKLGWSPGKKKERKKEETHQAELSRISKFCRIQAK